MHHGDGLEEIQVHFAALLGADLKDALGLFEDFDDLLSLVDRQREGLFAVDVLTGPHGFDRDFRVPVVGSDDRHHVDILAVEDTSIIAGDVEFEIFAFFALPLLDEIAALRRSAGSRRRRRRRS